MPQIVYPQWKKEFAQLWNGVILPSALPATLYLGLRADQPTAIDTLANMSEIAGGGYARVAIARNVTNFADSGGAVDWQYTIPQQVFPTFTGAPSLNGATHWFLCDQATGTTGHLYACGQLVPGALQNALSAAASVGDFTITVPAAMAAALGLGDYLLIGTTGNFNPNQEGHIITNINATTGVIQFQFALTSAHVIGEPVIRDYSVRYYSGGGVEKVTLTLLIGTLP